MYIYEKCMYIYIYSVVASATSSCGITSGTDFLTSAVILNWLWIYINIYIYTDVASATSSSELLAPLVF